MSILGEFREFALKGNMVDTAVGIILGGATGKVVSSLVSDVLMPPIGFLIGKVDFKNLKLVIGGLPGDPVSIQYGMFIQQTIDFLIIAFCVFLLVKAINSLRDLKRREEVAAPSPPEPTAQEKLLVEIRDLLKRREGVEGP